MLLGLICCLSSVSVHTSHEQATNITLIIFTETIYLHEVAVVSRSNEPSVDAMFHKIEFKVLYFASCCPSAQ